MWKRPGFSIPISSIPIDGGAREGSDLRRGRAARRVPGSRGGDLRGHAGRNRVATTHSRRGCRSRGWARGEAELDRAEIEDALIGRYGEDAVRAAFPSGVPEIAKARRLKLVPERERWSDDDSGEASEEVVEGDLPTAVKAAGAEVLRAIRVDG